MENLDESNEGEVLLVRRAALQRQLDRWHKRKGEFWKQLSKEKYMKDVDKKSNYFHSIASMKKRKKQILQLTISGRNIQNCRRIKKEIRGYFKIFISRNAYQELKLKKTWSRN